MKWLLYTLVAVVVFVAFLLVSAPAGFILGSFTEQVNKQQSDLLIADLGGSIWNGEGSLQYLNLPPVKVNWQLAAPALLTGTADSDIKLSADGLNASASASVDSKQGQVNDLVAAVNSRYINQLTRPLGLDVTGEFTLTDGNFVFDQRWLKSAGGALDWPGGPVTVETPGQVISASLPPLQGNIRMAAQDLILDVTSGGTPMMQIRLKPTGWAAVGINAIFLETAGISLSGSGYDSSTDPAILLEEKIF